MDFYTTLSHIAIQGLAGYWLDIFLVMVQPCISLIVLLGFNTEMARDLALNNYLIGIGGISSMAGAYYTGNALAWYEYWEIFGDNYKHYFYAQPTLHCVFALLFMFQTGLYSLYIAKLDHFIG